MNSKPSLKSANPDIERYVAALQAENLKLHKKIAKLQVEYLSAKNRIVALEEEIQKFHFPRKLSDEELKAEIKDSFERLADEFGYIKKTNTNG